MLTQSRLHEVLYYNVKERQFTWIAKIAKHRPGDRRCSPLAGLLPPPVPGDQARISGGFEEFYAVSLNELDQNPRWRRTRHPASEQHRSVCYFRPCVFS
jgi:hypothetical protein